ncbi:MAG: uroporphyrinogen decarboxylase family protein [bacterium]
MTERNNFLTALAGRQPDAVPLWELEFHLLNHYSAQPIILGAEFAALSAAERETALQRNAENMVAVAKKLGHAALTCPGGYWEAGPHDPAYYWLPDDYRWQQLAALRRAAGADIALVMFTSGMIMPPVGDDYQEFCYRLFDEPEEISASAEKTLSWGLSEAKRARDLGADAVCNPCDIGDNHGVFFSPSQLEEFWLPYFHRWTAGVRALGMRSILHSDGKLTAILELLAESELDALQALDPIAGMDIAAVKQQVGDRLCLIGNLDCGLLQLGTEAEVAEATRTIITAAKPGGGFIFGGTNAIFRGIPPENYAAALAVWREERTY